LRSGEQYLLLYKKEGAEWMPQRARPFSIELSRALHSFWVSKFEEKSLFGTAEQRWLRHLSSIQKIFENHKDNEALLRAAQWLFDSFVGDDQLLAFVKATVCLEILLGDKQLSDTIGLGKLLANRCAFLISTNRHEREVILDDFEAIYRTRCKIVHDGKNRL